MLKPIRNFWSTKTCNLIGTQHFSRQKHFPVFPQLFRAQVWGSDGTYLAAPVMIRFRRICRNIHCKHVIIGDLATPMPQTQKSTEVDAINKNPQPPHIASIFHSHIEAIGFQSKKASYNCSSRLQTQSRKAPSEPFPSLCTQPYQLRSSEIMCFLGTVRRIRFFRLALIPAVLVPSDEIIRADKEHAEEERCRVNSN